MKEQDESKQPDRATGARKGEEMVDSEGKESGREDSESTGAGRPTGTRTARDSTSINPKDPIDPKSPKMPPV